MRIVRAIATLFGFFALALVTASPAIGVTSSVTVTLTASPNPAPRGIDVTLTGTVSPVGGTFDGVSATMDVYHPTSCTPSVGTCTVFTAYVTWTIGALAAPATISVTAPVAGEHFVFFSINGCSTDCPTNSATVTVDIPKASATITYGPAGDVMPGATLHFTVGASVNAGPVQADLQANLPTTGLADPTGLPAGAIWNPAPSYYIDNTVTLDLSASYGFDAKVTAPVGTDLIISVIVRTMTGVSNDDLKRSVVIHVGPTATKPPATGPTGGPPSQRVGPTATKPPATGPTGGPSSQRVGPSPLASPTQVPTQDPAVTPSGDTLAISSASAIAATQVERTVAFTPGSVASSSDAVASQTGDAVPLVLAGGVTTLAACGGLILLLLQRGRLRRL